MAIVVEPVQHLYTQTDGQKKKRKREEWYLARESGKEGEKKL